MKPSVFLFEEIVRIDLAGDAGGVAFEFLAFVVAVEIFGIEVVGVALTVCSRRESKLAGEDRRWSRTCEAHLPTAPVR